MDLAAAATLLVGLAILGVLAEWRLHRNRTGIVSDLRVELAEIIKAAAIDAVKDAIGAERINGQAIEALAEHVTSLDERIAAVESTLNGGRSRIPGEADTNGG